MNLHINIHTYLVVIVNVRNLGVQGRSTYFCLGNQKTVKWVLAPNPKEIISSPGRQRGKGIPSNIEGCIVSPNTQPCHVQEITTNSMIGRKAHLRPGG
jgi:hypothetical protein